MLTGPLGHVHEGDAVEVGGAVARPSAARAPVRTSSACASRAPASEDALLALPRLGQARRPARRRVAARAPRRRRAARSSTATRGARLREVPGIGRARHPRGGGLVAGAGAALRALRLFLDEHGVPAAVAARVSCALCGAGAVELLQADPYAAHARSTGIGFATADALARALGVAARRTRAGSTPACIHALRAAEARRALPPAPRPSSSRAGARGCSAPTRRRRDRRLAASGRLVVDGRPRARAAAATRSSGGSPARAASCSTATAALDVDVPDDPPRTASFVPTDDQWAAVHAARSRTGCRSSPAGPAPARRPRCARSSTCCARQRRTRAPVRADRQGRAPAGRGHGRRGDDDPPAARVVARRGLRPRRGRPDRPASTCSIVDEASMLVAAARRRAVRTPSGPRTHVLLVGDVDQLAPVGPGRVLDDLIASEAVPVDAADRDLPPGRAAR